MPNYQSKIGGSGCISQRVKTSLQFLISPRTSPKLGLVLNSPRTSPKLGLVLNSLSDQTTGFI